MTAQRLVPASNPLAQLVPPHATASLPSCRPGLYEAKSFPQWGEEAASKETDSELKIKRGKRGKIILCVWFGDAGADSENALQRVSGRHTAAECVSSPLAAVLPRTLGEMCQRRPALSALFE